MKRITDILKSLLARQSFKNTFWNLFSTVVYPIFLLGTTPIFINYLGVEQFGLWMLVNSISQAMSIVNMGLGDANIKYIAAHRAHQDNDAIRKVVSTTFGLSVVVAAAIILFGIGFAYLAEINHWFKISDANRDIMGTCIRLAMILFSLKFLEIVVLSIFQGFERYDLQSKLSLVSKTAIMLANLIWVLLGSGLIVVLLSSVITQVVFLVIEIIWIKRSYSFLSFRLTYEKSEIKKVFSFSLWSWMQSVLAIVAVNVDKFMVAWFSGVTTLSYYALGYMVMTQVHAVFSASIGWVFPVVSRKRAQGELLNDYYKTMQGLLVTAGFVSVIAFLLIDKFLITLWLGAENAPAAYEFIHLFVYSNLFYLINIIPHHFLNGSGYVKQNTIAELVIKGLTIAGMIAGYYLLGDVGLIWGIIVTIGLLSPLKPFMLHCFGQIERSNFYFLESILAGALVIVFFESSNTILRIVLVCMFVSVFFLAYVKPGRLSQLLKLK